MFIRDGRLVADDTPDAVRAEAGTDDLEQAFLHIARGLEGVTA
jgi:ABC-2 type transport system ATP-binding protein